MSDFNRHQSKGGHDYDSNWLRKASHSKCEFITINGFESNDFLQAHQLRTFPSVILYKGPNWKVYRGEPDAGHLSNFVRETLKSDFQLPTSLTVTQVVLKGPWGESPKIAKTKAAGLSFSTEEGDTQELWVRSGPLKYKVELEGEEGPLDKDGLPPVVYVTPKNFQQIYGRGDVIWVLAEMVEESTRQAISEAALKIKRPPHYLVALVNLYEYVDGLNHVFRSPMLSTNSVFIQPAGETAYLTKGFDDEGNLLADLDWNQQVPTSEPPMHAGPSQGRPIALVGSTLKEWIDTAQESALVWVYNARDPAYKKEFELFLEASDKPELSHLKFAYMDGSRNDLKALNLPVKPFLMIQQGEVESLGGSMEDILPFVLTGQVGKVFKQTSN